jgi:hypothetical protein
MGAGWGGTAAWGQHGVRSAWLWLQRPERPEPLWPQHQHPGLRGDRAKTARGPKGPLWGQTNLCASSPPRPGGCSASHRVTAPVSPQKDPDSAADTAWWEKGCGETSFLSLLLSPRLSVWPSSRQGVTSTRHGRGPEPQLLPWSSQMALSAFTQGTDVYIRPRQARKGVPRPSISQKWTRSRSGDR